MKSFDIYSAGRRAAAVLKPCILGSTVILFLVWSCTRIWAALVFLVISFTGSVRSLML